MNTKDKKLYDALIIILDALIDYETIDEELQQEIEQTRKQNYKLLKRFF